MAADAVAQGDEVGLGVGPEGQMLQGAGGADAGAGACMGHAELDGNPVDLGQLDDGEIAVVIHAQEGVQAAGHPVHVEQGHQGTAHDLREEVDVLLDVSGHEGQVMNAAGMLAHVSSPLWRRQ